VTLLQQFQAARRAGAPLIAIRTPDPAATQEAILRNYNGSPPPAVAWDTVRGFTRASEPGQALLSTLDDPGQLPDLMTKPESWYDRLFIAAANLAISSLALLLALYVLWRLLEGVLSLPRLP
jgi:hypothetical protein